MKTTYEMPMRTVILRPYLDRSAPRFRLQVWEGQTTGGMFGRTYLRYSFSELTKGKRAIELFSGADFGCSPMHAIDSDDTIASLLSFLTLRQGDTDAEYFADYTPAQLDFADTHAETLQCAIYDRFGWSR